MLTKKSKDRFKIEIVAKKSSNKVSNFQPTQKILKQDFNNRSLQFKHRRVQSSHTTATKNAKNKINSTNKQRGSEDSQMKRMDSDEYFCCYTTVQSKRITQFCRHNSGEYSQNLQKPKASELFSNQIMKKLDSQILKKSLNRITSFKQVDCKKTEKMRSLEKEENQIKKKTNLHIYVDNINAIKCSSITLKKPPSYKRSLLMPSKSLTSSPDNHPNRKKIKITKRPSSRIMAFNTNNSDMLYMKKVKSFLDFLFKINFSNRISVSLNLNSLDTIEKKRVFVGSGNNSELVKAILRKRFWLQIVDSSLEDNIVFYWTQHSLTDVQKMQKHSFFQDRYENIAFRNKAKPLNSQNIIYNRQIMSQKDAESVEYYIQPDGFIVPDSSFYCATKITNHLPSNGCINSKRKLFKSLFHYYTFHLKKDPFEVVPLTYSIKNCEDPQFKRFIRDNESNQSQIWIIKPGEDTNRGQGIKLARINEIGDIIQKQSRKTYIIQKYMQNPLLYNGRKFDIRHFLLVTSVNGIIKAYWYSEGYLRTCSENYKTQNIKDQFVHLTNDAVQKRSASYGKFQAGNKISYNEFQRYLDSRHSESKIKVESILQKMKKIVLDVMIANYSTIDHLRNSSNFQLFGLDFMIDRKFNPWLIEINSNPCLQTSCHLLERIIPGVIQQTIRMGVDPIIPPSNNFPQKHQFGLNDHYISSCKYQLLIDELSLEKTVPVNYQLIDEEDIEG